MFKKKKKKGRAVAENSPSAASLFYLFIPAIPALHNTGEIGKPV